MRYVCFSKIFVDPFCQLTVHAFLCMRRHDVGMAKKLPVRPHLRAWRQAMGWKLMPLAEQLGVTHCCVIGWEPGNLAWTTQLLPRSQMLTASPPQNCRYIPPTRRERDLCIAFSKRYAASTSAGSTGSRI